jgi:hypothetical protein
MSITTPYLLAHERWVLAHWSDHPGEVARANAYMAWTAGHIFCLVAMYWSNWFSTLWSTFVVAHRICVQQSWPYRHWPWLLCLGDLTEWGCDQYPPLMSQQIRCCDWHRILNKGIKVSLLSVQQMRAGRWVPLHSMTARFKQEVEVSHSDLIRSYI